MLMHLFRLIWNRKLSNLLIILELTLAFVVLYFVSATALHLWSMYNRPLGFEWQSHYSMTINQGAEASESDMERLNGMIDRLEQRSDIDWVHIVKQALFQNWHWSTSINHEGDYIQTYMNTLSDGAAEDLGVTLLSGRFFNEGDAGQAWLPVLINRAVSERLFGEGVDPLGQNINPPSEDQPDQEQTEYRVIGVIEDFRQSGEFWGDEYYVLARFDTSRNDTFANSLVIRPQDGLSATFEASLLQEMTQMAPSWNITVRPLADYRQDRIRSVMTPIILSGIVAGFLLLMVAFGLFGVLWQNVTRRTHELGLRRALGASAADIFKQITIEMMLVASFAIVLGTLITIQFTLLGTFSSLNWMTTIKGSVLAAVVLLMLVAICTLYPGWIASRKQPADALRYE